ncbi:MAG TPA: rhodanese-like domain-containing protein [Myxococcales bacterium]|nr:rhodanese-like domain-containing protein [Myxococcales bacterium]
MKILRMTLALMALLLAAATARAAEKDEGFGRLTVDQVADLIAKKGADVYDNNGKDEWQKGHVPTAKWVQFNAVKESDLPTDHSRTLVFYCHNEH